MRVVRHTIDGDELLLTTRDNPGDIFLQFLFAIGLNGAGTSRHRENNMEIDL